VDIKSIDIRLIKFHFIAIGISLIFITIWQLGEPYGWIVAFVVMYAFIMFFKAVRDHIQFGNFTHTKMDYWITWLKKFLLGKYENAPKTWDGWHLMDGLTISLPLWYIIAIINRFVLGCEWYWTIIAWVVVWIVVYQYFNWWYHHRLPKVKQKWFMRSWRD